MIEEKGFPVVCSECGARMIAKKSIFQEYFGVLDAGVATCLECNSFLILTFNEDKKEFISILYDKKKALDEKNLH